ncbi:MAG: Sec-independent protein translocase subunit TatA/TatB [Planctomycetota bacterium]|jgi:Sec-independent protein translocase protein TatA
MFGIGFFELAILALIAFVCIPTQDLPRLLQSLGRLVGRARELRETLDREVQALHTLENEGDTAQPDETTTEAPPASPPPPIDSSDETRGAPEDQTPRIPDHLKQQTLFDRETMV